MLWINLERRITEGVLESKNIIGKTGDLEVLLVVIIQTKTGQEAPY